MVTAASKPDTNQSADGRLASEVWKALNYHFWVPKDHITIEVRDAWVTLRGTIDWLSEKGAIGNLILAVSGVRGLTNALTVSTQGAWQAPAATRNHSRASLR